MEQAEISVHQVRIYRSLVSTKRWMTTKEVAAVAAVSLRNASLHLSRFVKLGICDQAEVYPGHRYRLSEKADKRNIAYMQRLRQAEEALQNLLNSEEQG